MPNTTSKKLYGVFTPEPNASIQSVIDQIVPAIEAGLPWLQIRDKSTDRFYWPAWQEIANLCQSTYCQLVINDSVELALHLTNHRKDAQPVGLHLGQQDQPLTQARQQHPQGVIGITCHDSVELAQKACALGADYVAFGRFFPSKTKPEATTANINTIDAFAQWQKMTNHTAEIAVIGGLDQHNIHQLINTPASLFAVSAGLWKAPCIRNAVLEMLQAIDQAAEQ